MLWHIGLIWCYIRPMLMVMTIERVQESITEDAADGINIYI